MTPKSVPISAYIICKNEASVIGDCLASLDICQEIVVVDSGSTDDTIAIVEDFRARGWPIRLIRRDWPGFARQKQFALDQCTLHWCLNLDADERLDEEARRVLASGSYDRPGVAAYAIRRRDYLAGYGYTPSFVHAQRIVRLVRKGAARYDLEALVHESLLTDATIETLRQGTLLHFRDLSLSDDAARADTYATLKAREKFARGRKPSFLRLAFNPAVRFLKSYVFQRYCLCGTPGFIYAGMLAYYVFLTEAKLYRLAVAAAGERRNTTTSA